MQISLGGGVKAGSVGCIVDREGNVYATLAFAPGVSIGVPLTTGFGVVSDKSKGYIKAISGWSSTVTALGGIGGTVGITSEGNIIGEMAASGSAGISANIGYTWFVGNVYKR